MMHLAVASLLCSVFVRFRAAIPHICRGGGGGISKDYHKGERASKGDDGGE